MVASHAGVAQMGNLQYGLFWTDPWRFLRSRQAYREAANATRFLRINNAIPTATRAMAEGSGMVRTRLSMASGMGLLLVLKASRLNWVKPAVPWKSRLPIWVAVVASTPPAELVRRR